MDLRTVLKADAVTRGLMGCPLLIGAETLKTLTARNAGFLSGTGVMLLVVFGSIVFVARSPSIRPWTVYSIILGNAAWVIASIGLPLIGIITPNAAGWVLLIVQAIGVVAFVVLETSTASARTHMNGGATT